MSSASKKNESLKSKIFHELSEYWIIVAYLTIAFATFTLYRRIILAAHDISYANYGFALFKALILGKVIMIGAVFKLGDGLENSPLILPVLYKTMLFTIFVAAFTVLEYALKGLWDGVGLMGGFNVFIAKGPHELFANSLIVFVTFIPFFSVKELGRIFGQDTIRALFFRHRKP